MDEEAININYESEASTVNLEDITDCEYFIRDYLLPLKEKDPKFTELMIGDNGYFNGYNPVGAHDLAWLGYFAGKNTALKSITFSLHDNARDEYSIKQFCKGLNHNRSIENMVFDSLSEDEVGSSISELLYRRE